MTVRAVEVTEYGDSGVLTPRERPEPEPAPGEVGIAVEAAGVNFADVEQRRGNYPEGPTPPFVPGLEVAGTVTSVERAGDTDLSVGDRVAALTSSGGYAAFATAPVETTFPVPDSLSMPAATALPVQGLTAHNVLHEWGDLSAGERVLVHAGAGGVGSLAVQLADAAGATVFATASTAAKRDLASTLGAGVTIDYTTTDVADAVLAETDGRGVDLVVDGVGGEAFSASVEALAPAGRVVSFGMASGSVPTVATPRLFFENQSVVGYHLDHALEHVPDRVLGAVPSLLDHLSTGRVEVVVDERVPLERAATAHEALANRETVGKVVLEP
ncbi:quinone oxidoreductase family protein [Haloarcula pellucida]|uniref:Alcohol dehydrogenase n=1 Tax=Haloarcula pellucida TaxID=1427151 RepID=A0A830GR66_9EURY|nr:NADPH:quinone oxidoreductase family protein [Halomicroarcula pellucida]MBX0350071.1 NADPH:quinone oxidoreductase family protein [Halomicroarcula pellucida]GGO00286.1 alcohol dehydrogenase [Halomicroarcula pellucida]